MKMQKRQAGTHRGIFPIPLGLDRKLSDGFAMQTQKRKPLEKTDPCFILPLSHPTDSCRD